MALPTPAESAKSATGGVEAPTEPVDLAPEDFYLEGSNLVFTAAYHLKRGACCHSDCRHCPYRKPG